MSRSLVVVGSLNVDLLFAVERLPLPGETLAARAFTRAPGGKGANQAAAAARLGARTAMVGCVGEDDAASLLLHALGESGVDVAAVARTSIATGTAVILVALDGENSIVLAPGANAAWPEEHLASQRKRIAAAGMVLTQLETPEAVLTQVLDLTGQAAVPVMLDPAPAKPLPAALLQRLAWLTPNETEARFYAPAVRHDVQSEEDARQICLRLRELGPRNILLKLGAQGAAVLTEDDAWHFAPAPRTAAVDTTGAGDVLNAAFAASLLREASVEEALRFAMAAASLSVTQRGGMAAAPTLDAVRHFLANA